LNTVRRRSCLALLLFASLAACGDDSESALPEAADLPKGDVAVVADVPISRRAFDRRLAAVRRSQGKANHLSYEQLKLQTMSDLLQYAWLSQEARGKDVEVTSAEVHKRLAIAKRQFESKRDYKRFLGAQTEQDLLYQLHRQLLSEKLDEKLRDDGADPEKARKDFQERWSGKTACAPSFMVPSCGNA
jgi:predicted small lipoprotein YifL